MFLLLFRGGDNAFVNCIFNPTISINWTIVFVSAITWFYVSMFVLVTRLHGAMDLSFVLVTRLMVLRIFRLFW